MGKNVGAVPAAKVVVGATVGIEDTPDAMSESGTAVGFVDASVNVNVNERERSGNGSRQRRKRAVRMTRTAWTSMSRQM